MRLLASLSAALALAACGGSTTTEAPCGFGPGVPGEATTYAGTSAGACMFPAGLSLYAAVAPAVYDGARACGACVEATGPAGTATLAVVDLCPECAATQLDLSPAAWTALTGADPGRAAITWRFVPCAVSGPVRFVASAGVNDWYASVVVQDHRWPIAAVELLPAGATAWVPLARDATNQWIGSASSAGFSTPLHFRAMDAFGRITATDVPMPALSAGAEAIAPQFGDACGG